METPSFTLEVAKKFGPEPSLVPLFIEALEIGQGGGSNPEDVFKSTLLKSSPELVQRILVGWKNTPKPKRARKVAPEQQGLRYPNDSSWRERVQTRIAEYTTYHAAIKRYKRSLIAAKCAAQWRLVCRTGHLHMPCAPTSRLLYEGHGRFWGEFTVGFCEVAV